MAISYYLLQIPSVLLFSLLILSGALAGGLGTYLFRRHIKLKILRSHNEVTGFLFLAIASFYALLLSFVVLVVWEQLNETHSNLSKEGSSALSLYHDIKFYPDTTESKKLMTAYIDFVYNVIDEELPNMQMLKLSRKTPESFSKVFYEMEHLNPKSQFQIQLVTQMFNHLNELSTYRGLRIASIDTEIPSPMWLPIIFGAFITLMCAMLLDIEHTRIHLIITGMLGAVIGMFLFILIVLDHPYTGSHAIKPKSYKEIFTLERWDTDKTLLNNNKSNK
ncbi:MAG: DUF4239 domain-containing protein [Bacteroidota bacterium]|nr:DUF4239 domain-containing protein [Bacteroidota bacterium]MDP3144040.1 DUF4239 domain-containing protein [Bacteroidota bacterium]MDP3557464.1 DUF4239 domain-containing protein [Bacteroidota bacterium]